MEEKESGVWVEGNLVKQKDGKKYKVVSESENFGGWTWNELVRFWIKKV